MDRILRAERKYILKLCKKIKKTGCNVLLIQKSILRDAVNDLSLHFLAKMKIMVITNIERDEIEFVTKTLGCRPVAHIDSFTKEKLAEAALAQEARPPSPLPVLAGRETTPTLKTGGGGRQQAAAAVASCLRWLSALPRSCPGLACCSRRWARVRRS